MIHSLYSVTHTPLPPSLDISHFTTTATTTSAANMWRNSASLSAKRLNLVFSNPNIIRHHNHHLPNPNFSQSNIFNSRFAPVSQLYSSTIPQSSPDPVKLGVSKLDAVLPPPPPLFLDAAGVVSHFGRCYWELSKARLSMLVVATSGTGYVLGSGQVIDFAGLCWTCVGTMMVAASANSLNQVFEVKNDALMKRTMQRPLPSGRMTVSHAVMWASAMGLTGTGLLAWNANALAAGLAASNLLLYAFIYTPLKQIHPVNTWVGAVVGAIPPLLGWAAASGEISLNGMILPAALYFWQLPHFMALAFLCRNDYAAGGYKMISLFDHTGRRTALVALRNCLYLIPLGYLAYDWGLTSGWFCLESSLFTLAISATALSFYFDRTTKNARRMFFASLLYLPVFMSGLMFHRLYDNWQTCLDGDSTKVPVVQSSVCIEDNKRVEAQKPEKDPFIGKQVRAPVAYASIAPFPFLPAPSYAES